MAEEKKTTTKKAAPAKKTTVKTSSAKKAAPAKKTTVKTSSAKKAAPAKKTTAKKPATKKSDNNPRLYEKYLKDIVPTIKKEFKYSSIMEVPKLDKIVINVGAGEGAKDSKVIDSIVSEIAQITGQKPIVTKAKKSIASFKIRDGMPIGCKVTLRGKRMYHFLDKLVSIALPRVRDFQGVSSNAFDGRGNYTLGIKEQIIFPEIDYDSISTIRGMDVVLVTTANSDKEGYSLLKKLGMPFAETED